MGKKARRCDSPVEAYNADDFISRIPEEILVSIVSLLNLKDAAATAILSRRWRNVWKSITDLDLDCKVTLLDSRSRNTERVKFINWVNRVIRHHKIPALDTFKIGFDLDKTSKSAIDNWIRVAISKKVKRLELDLMEDWTSIRGDLRRSYTFPFKLFTSRRSNVATVSGLRSLRVLCLKRVNVSDEVVEYLLLNCPVLESLSVYGSGDLVNVKVTGQSLKLKSLELVFCSGIKSVELRDTYLGSFSYLGPMFSLYLKNVPKLEVVTIGAELSVVENIVVGQLACCFNQLQFLNLIIVSFPENMIFLNIPELPKLKELILKVGAWNDQSLLGLTSLIKVSPNLEKFSMQLIWVNPTNSRREILEGEPFVHRSLKIVEIHGYFGRVSEAELAMYLIKNAPALKKLFIDPRDEMTIYQSCNKTENQREIEDSARKHALQHLQPRIPPHVEFVLN